MKEWLQRLKNREMFQGARHELFAEATCYRAGFKVEHEDEKDGRSGYPRRQECQGSSERDVDAGTLSSHSVRTTPVFEFHRGLTVRLPSMSTTITSTSTPLASPAYYSVNRRPRDDAELGSAAEDSWLGCRIATVYLVLG